MGLLPSNVCVLSYKPGFRSGNLDHSFQRGGRTACSRLLRTGIYHVVVNMRFLGVTAWSLSELGGGPRGSPTSGSLHLGRGEGNRLADEPIHKQLMSRCDCAVMKIRTGQGVESDQQAVLAQIQWSRDSSVMNEEQARWTPGGGAFWAEGTATQVQGGGWCAGSRVVRAEREEERTQRQ